MIRILGATLVLVLAAALGAEAARKPKPPRQGTLTAARALLDRAVREIERKGEEEATLAFNDPKGKFVESDLHVICFGPDNRLIAHPTLVGTDVTTVKGENGREFGLELTAVGARGEGAIEDRALNPLTNRAQARVTYVKRAVGLVCAVSAFKP